MTFFRSSGLGKVLLINCYAEALRIKSSFFALTAGSDYTAVSCILKNFASSSLVSTYEQGAKLTLYNNMFINSAQVYSLPIALEHNNLYTSKAKSNILEIHDEFLYNDLAEDHTPWLLRKGLDTTATYATKTVGGAYGSILMMTGDKDGNIANDGTQIVASLPVTAVRGELFAEVNLRLNTSTDASSLTFGLIDGTDLLEPFEIGSDDVITANRNNSVAFVYDADATTKKWFGCAIKNGVQDTNNTTPIDSSPPLGVYQKLGMEINISGNVINFYINDVLVKSSQGSVGVDNLTNLYVTVIANSIGNVSRGIQIDYIKIRNNR